MSLLEALIFGPGKGKTERFTRTPSSTSALSAPDPEVARRSAIFRRQVSEWTASGRLGVPLLTLPDAPTPQLGQCVSCGEPIPEGWRCGLCLQAVYLALRTEPPETSRRREEEPR